MPADRSSYEVHLDADPGRDPRARHAAPSQAERVFRLAVCGDFSGRAGSASPVAGSPRAWRVDRDDFDAVLATISPSLQIALGDGMVVDVRIREIDDFHPDQLFARVPQFARLRELRAQLANPSTFGRAAAELSAPTPPPVRPTTLTQAGLLDAIVGANMPPPDTGTGAHAGGSGSTDDLYAFIQRIMAPHLVARTDPRQAELIAQADSAIAAIMRALLHHPAFQSMESLWRGVFRLVRHVDTDERLQIHLVDVTREAMGADLAGAGDTRSTGLFRRLEALAPAEEGGWAVLVAHGVFGGDSADIEVLTRLAAVGAALDAPWIAEAHPDLAMGGLPESATASWRRLRASDAARYLGLAMPRVLLRLPYGAASDEIEEFAFEELEGPEAHGSYLWGNPALFCATLLAEGFAERGAGLAAGASTVIEGLPLHLVRRDGQTTAKPCAEVVMGEEDALALLEAGFMPMVAFRDQDAVRIPRVQSVAEPLARLSGRLAR